MTAISGSGPTTYLFLFIEALEQAAAELGFSERQARQLATETALGFTASVRLVCCRQAEGRTHLSCFRAADQLAG